ncbi:MAG: FHA domain-containing protein [Gracilibacteraceae bacterium]|nr:FHA domain-containing protein [Gracilibacteraceae bacterium]
MQTSRKLILLLLATLFAVVLFLAALVWRAALAWPAPMAILLTAVGAACFAAVLLLGYKRAAGTETRAASASPAPPRPPAAGSRRAAPPAAPRTPRPPAGPTPDGTILLFNNDRPGGEFGGDHAFAGGRRGLRLSWEIDGVAQNAVIFDFPIVIGRDENCQIVISLPSISRRHARIARENYEYILTDLGSSNGSIVNGERTSGGARLAPGCRVELGGVQLKIEFI